MTQYVGAIDQGTTSSRFIVFDHAGRVVGSAQAEHEQIFPQAGWVEHDAREIAAKVTNVVEQGLDGAGITASALHAIGITNQRETTLVWDAETGAPVANAIVWQDTRTDAICKRLIEAGHQEAFRATTGLPLATYFAGPKITWILESDPDLRRRAEAGELRFGTMDSWVLWNLLDGLHVTDVTNASRTLMMDLETLDWDDRLLDLLHVPRSMLPEIRSSSEPYGVASGALAGVPVAGVLGDQQAALFGQACFEPGDAKNTYGTGCFMLMNTGTSPTPSEAGLLTTVAYRLGDAAPVYALEGSIAIAGALVQWLRDNLGLIEDSAEVEELAASVEDNGGVYFVPAFSGLFAPHWRSDARGVIAGLTRFATKGHLARSALEATAFQTNEVLEAMRSDSGVELTSLKVDGGMVVNELLMQFQADVLDVPVVRPVVAETTALGAAYAAGLATGFWDSTDDVRANWQEDKRWEPSMAPETRSAMVDRWSAAVTRTLGWEG